MGTDIKAIFNCFMSIGNCFLLSVTFLASLYIWKSPHGRDHPSTIKKRFLSVFFMLFIGPCFLYAGLNKTTLEQESFLEILGIRKSGLVQAFVFPLVLTMILFLGPISMEFSNWPLSKQISDIDDENHIDKLDNLNNLIWLRNHIVAPFSEEFTFRSCMMPLLLQCLPPLTAVAVNPLLFGVAHFHHMQERIRFGMDFETALKISCFQFIYTTMFGAYSAYILYRTGHFISIFIVHAFCNHMGFPAVWEVMNYKKEKQIIVSILFILGFVLWCFLLKPLTEPAWYYHKSIWYTV